MDEKVNPGGNTKEVSDFYLQRAVGLHQKVFSADRKPSDKFYLTHFRQYFRYWRYFHCYCSSPSLQYRAYSKDSCR
jgi:hypothetical protein